MLFFFLPLVTLTAVAGVGTSRRARLYLDAVLSTIAGVTLLLVPDLLLSYFTTASQTKAPLQILSARLLGSSVIATTAFVYKSSSQSPGNCAYAASLARGITASVLFSVVLHVCLDRNAGYHWSPRFSRLTLPATACWFASHFVLAVGCDAVPIRQSSLSLRWFLLCDYFFLHTVAVFSLLFPEKLLRIHRHLEPDAVSTAIIRMHGAFLLGMASACHSVTNTGDLRSQTFIHSVHLYSAFCATAIFAHQYSQPYSHDSLPLLSAVFICLAWALSSIIGLSVTSLAQTSFQHNTKYTYYNKQAHLRASTSTSALNVERSWGFDTCFVNQQRKNPMLASQNAMI